MGHGLNSFNMRLGSPVARIPFNPSITPLQEDLTMAQTRPCEAQGTPGLLQSENHQEGSEAADHHKADVSMPLYIVSGS